MTTKCPRCKKDVEYSFENPFRPFCSQRCRDIDLGAWITGANAIPGKPLTEDPNSDSSEESPQDPESLPQ